MPPHGEKVTTAYADRPYAERFAVMGQPAEQAFETWAATREVVIDRLGFDRSPLPKEAMLQLPPFLRHLPDYVMYDRNEGTYLVDCIGTANPLGFKVRASKLDVLGFYAEKGAHPQLFIYCSTTDSYSFMSYYNALATKGPMEHFNNDGNAYFFIKNDTWTPVPRG